MERNNKIAYVNFLGGSNTYDYLTYEQANKQFDRCVNNGQSLFVVWLQSDDFCAWKVVNRYAEGASFEQKPMTADDVFNSCTGND